MGLAWPPSLSPPLRLKMTEVRLAPSLAPLAPSDPASFDTTVQCADHANDWPAEHQYCLPENWGLQCGACLQTCYSVETAGGQPFLPFQYTFPTVELFAATCDRKTLGSKYSNESSLGIYW